jgi:hypothetical protein
MKAFLTDFNLILLACLACFAAGVVFSQRVKDYLKGVPGELRSTLTAVEANASDAIKAAQAKVLTELKNKAGVQTPLPPASQPLAPVASAPASAAVPFPSPGPAPAPAVVVSAAPPA